MLRPWQIEAFAKDMPGFRPLVAYEAAIPIHEAYVEVRLLRKHDLSPLERMVVACAMGAVNTIEAMDIVLGSGRALLRSVVAGLMSSDLLEMTSDEGLADGRLIALTTKGREAAEHAAQIVPTAATIKVSYDGLLGQLQVALKYRLLNRHDVALRQLHVIPSAFQPPTATDLDPGLLRRYLKQLERADPRQASRGELHDVIAVSGVVKLYRAVDVVAFDAEDRSEVAFRVFESDMMLREHGERLGRLFQRNPDVLPFVNIREEGYTADDGEGAPTLLDQEVVRAADDVARELAELEPIIARGGQCVEVESTEGDGEASPDSGNMRKQGSTREELESLKLRYAELQRQRDSVRTVGTLEHSEILIKALQTCRRRLIIVSPWLSADVVDRQFLDKLEKALKRGVEVTILYGMPKRKHPSAQDEQKERWSERSAERIRHLSRSSIKGHLRVERLGNTHEKVLIVDKKFALVTSFNFLSFRGDPSRGFRQETGVYHEIPEKVDQLAEQMLGRLERDQLTRSE